MNDKEFLQRQAADARAAIGGTVRWIVGDLEENYDPRKLLKRVESHFLTLGGVVAASAIAASALFGRKRKKSDSDDQSSSPPIPASEARSDRAKSGRVGPLENIVPLVTELFALARPVITAIGAFTAARAEKTNGHAEPGPVKPPPRRRSRKSS